MQHNSKEYLSLQGYTDHGLPDYISRPSGILISAVKYRPYFLLCVQKVRDGVLSLIHCRFDGVSTVEGYAQCW
jgi:hypothetical protein